ncbi:MAG: SPFH domain-containing protein [Archangium sp.]|nr:SPFH domain-containing protein [Archangium sp.]MDP3156104.1 SPFH domain-containing protein [Archangium sp.]MDP3571441.1 SPFH domain-containing protein [Archangium sp.]
MEISFAGLVFGAVGWFLLVYVIRGFFTVNQNERVVKTSFGRAQRLTTTTLDNPMSEYLRPDERERYNYPQLSVIQPGGPYFKWPWEKIYKVSIATETVNLAFDAEDINANRGGTELDAVTKDQLNIGLVGQLRFRVSDQNLYAYIFGVKRPLVHVLGYFVSILRQKIASFEAPDTGASGATAVAAAHGADLAVAAGVSINDLRKNLRLLNEDMDKGCMSSTARYGIVLDASLITGIDPPPDVESALAAINTAHNSVGAEVSLAQASADQKLVQSRRAVEIQTLNSQAEVEPLVQLAQQLADLKKNGGSGVLDAYVRNVKLSLFSKAKNAFVEVKP